MTWFAATNQLHTAVVTGDRLAERQVVRKDGAAAAFAEILLLSMTLLSGYHKQTLEAITFWDGGVLDM